MSIFDELADIARERHFGHETERISERELCRVTRIPIPWCLGCVKGFHKYTRVPLPGAEDFEPPVAEVVAAEVAPVEITPADATPPPLEYSQIDLAGGQIEGIKKIWRDGELVYESLERALKDGVDEGRKP